MGEVEYAKKTGSLTRQTILCLALLNLFFISVNSFLGSALVQVSSQNFGVEPISSKTLVWSQFHSSYAIHTLFS